MTDIEILGPIWQKSSLTPASACQDTVKGTVSVLQKRDNLSLSQSSLESVHVILKQMAVFLA
jgi:hypothetical protein